MIIPEFLIVFFTFFRVFTAFLYILVEHSVEEMSFYFERNNMILKRLDFGFFSLLVGISITLFKRFAKWAENAESGGYLRGVVLWKIEDGWLSL